MAKTLREAIVSALSQTGIGFEVLIIDDGSHDNTHHILKEFQSHPKIRIFSLPTNRGLSYCRNYLLSRAKGKFWSILDADDMLSPNKVETHHRLLSQDSNVGVVLGKSIVLGGTEDTFILPHVGFKGGWDLSSQYQATHSATTWRTQLIHHWGGYDKSNELVEAVNLYLKVGDTHSQLWDDTIVALKRINRLNSFRTEIRGQEHRLSQKLLAQTIQRRYQKQVDFSKMGLT